ncbi:calcium-binding protein [Actinoplanes utahensis]|uniref:Calcium-binding protein n=1 Tax=Actinoplanes utahensis TaxID=1869 RepID=A0A0A6X8G1_ACTUT|nr:hypothetical protein [Actinoplanes utahensis]KHD76417.1 hypothetical protein MB27_17040 [Actinoplanes utahensis]GIF29805.1 hypothetical protein Aut01nite_27910 [Actinoplanes utahensis]
MRTRHLAVALLSTTLVTAFATPAQAATTGVAYVAGTPDGFSTIQFKAATGKANRIVVTNGPSHHYITIDDTFPIKPGKFCKQATGDKTKVHCGLSENNRFIEIATYDRDDTVTNRTTSKLVAHGGTGNDTITGGARGEVLYGNDGDDRIYGNGGDDHILGGNGGDVLHGGAGNDRLIGGNGKDEMYGGAGRNHIG